MRHDLQSRLWALPNGCGETVVILGFEGRAQPLEKSVRGARVRTQHQGVQRVISTQHFSRQVGHQAQRIMTAGYPADGLLQSCGVDARVQDQINREQPAR